MNRLSQWLTKHKQNGTQNTQGILNRCLEVLAKAVVYVQRNRKKLDPYAALLLALVPILQHYVGLVDNAATTVLILLLPYLGLRLLAVLPDFRLSSLRFAAFLIAFFLYKLVDHGTYFTEVAQVGLMCFFLICACWECIDTAALKKAAALISMLASAVLIVQYLCYYVLDFHLQMVPVSLLLEESAPWVLGAQTGKVAVTGAVSKLYRPSAFFLEPSHLFLYGFPSLFFTLFALKGNRKSLFAAMLISLGMVLCTSGMGIAVTVGAWGLYIALRNPEDGSFRLRNILRRQNLIMIGVLLGAVVLAVLFVPFVRNSVVRIFSNSEGSTAIDGRTEVAMITLRKMTLGQWIIGTSDSTAHLNFNMPGFMATAYKYGIIGIVLSYEIYVRGLFKLDMPYFWYCVILLAVSFFSAHTHGTFFMLFYVLLLKEGYRVSREPWIGQIKSLCINLYKKVIPLFSRHKDSR